MGTLLYRFDGLDMLGVLEARTTARGQVVLRIEPYAGKPVLWVALQRHPDDVGEVKVVTTLPLIAVDGRPERFLLDVVGKAGSCVLSLEAADARGWGFAYALGRVDCVGPGTCSADAQQPSVYWGSRKEDATPGVVPPVQPYRLTIVLDTLTEAIELGFCALRVTGQVSIASPGLASVERPDV